MADSTFSPSSRAWIPNAPLSIAGTGLRRVTRALRPPWMLAALLVTGATVGVLALEVGEIDLEQQRNAVVTSNEMKSDSVRSAEAANARARIRTADLRLALAAQADQLSSTEGFLK